MRSSGCLLSTTFLEGHIHFLPCHFIFPALKSFLKAFFGVTSHFRFKSESIWYCLICILHGCLYSVMIPVSPLLSCLYEVFKFLLSSELAFSKLYFWKWGFFFSVTSYLPCHIRPLISRFFFLNPIFCYSAAGPSSLLSCITDILFHLSCTSHRYWNSNKLQPCI